METKEAKVAAIPIIVNSLLKAVDVPLEGLKGPMYYSKKDIFLRGYATIGIGVALLLFLGVTILRSAAGRLSPVSPKPVSETPQVALERLKNVMKSFQFTNEDDVNRKNIHNIDKAFRTYLGTLMGISNETAQSSTASYFLNYDTQKRLSAETLTITKTVLKQLDTLIYGRRVVKEAVDKMLQGIKEIIQLTTIGRNK